MLLGPLQIETSGEEPDDAGSGGESLSTRDLR